MNKKRKHNNVHITYRGQQIPGPRFPRIFSCITWQGIHPQPVRNMHLPLCASLKNTRTMNRLIEILLITFILSACNSHKKLTELELYDSLFPSKYTKTYPINLETKIAEGTRYIEFENKTSIMFFNVDSVLNYAESGIIKDSLCDKKKEDLQTLIRLLENNKLSFYRIELETNPEEYRQLGLPKPKRYERNYVKPYGYNIQTDTINKIRLNVFKDWMISELCLSRGYLVKDKLNNCFADSILYRVTVFNDGHGGESLAFKNNQSFFTVKVYSDIVWPDFDCMSKEEIEKWRNK